MISDYHFHPNKDELCIDTLATGERLKPLLRLLEEEEDKFRNYINVTSFLHKSTDLLTRSTNSEQHLHRIEEEKHYEQ